MPPWRSFRPARGIAFEFFYAGADGFDLRAESCVEFADFSVDREDLFREFLALENGMSSHDGKTLRRSFDRAAKRSPLSAVTAFASEAQVVIGQKSFRPNEGGLEDPGRARLAGIPRSQGHAGNWRCDPLPRRHGPVDPGARRRLSLWPESQPAGALGRCRAFFEDSAGQGWPPSRSPTTTMAAWRFDATGSAMT